MRSGGGASACFGLYQKSVVARDLVCFAAVRCHRLDHPVHLECMQVCVDKYIIYMYYVCVCVCVCVYIMYNVGGDGFDHAVHLDHIDVSYVCVCVRV